MEREMWDRSEWALTIGLLIFVFPVGAAAMLRKFFGLRVWR